MSKLKTPFLLTIMLAAFMFVSEMDYQDQLDQHNYTLTKGISK